MYCTFHSRSSPHNSPRLFQTADRHRGIYKVAERGEGILCPLSAELKKKKVIEVSDDFDVCCVL